MEKILTLEQAIKKSEQLQQEKKKTVICGGCFDILHVGHVAFLEKAKQAGDTLFVLLESDETVRKSKGENRPINSQTNRARVLAALSVVDYIVLLPPLPTNADYDSVLFELKPAIIATTAGDPYRNHKERQAQAISAEVIDVVLPILDHSTSRIVKILEELSV